MQFRACLIVVLAGWMVPLVSVAGDVKTLPGTQPLTVEGDLAMILVEGVDRFLLNELKHSVERRAQHWNRDTSSAEAYNKSIEPNRQRLAHILGLRDSRSKARLDLPLSRPPAFISVAESPHFEVFAIRWPVLSPPGGQWEALASVHLEGLLLAPKDDAIATVVAVPDAGQLPEDVVGLSGKIPYEAQFARQLAESGCKVIVPVLINRDMDKRTVKERGPGANLTHREYIYRPAFELGRHVIGYELQKVFAAIDHFAAEQGPGLGSRALRTGVIGYGEGGMLALCAAALDSRISSCCVSGYFGPHENVWQQPIDRNVFRLLNEFGDAELGSMVLPRKLIVEAALGPGLELPGEGGAPARLVPHSIEDVRREFARVEEWAEKLATTEGPVLTRAALGNGDHEHRAAAPFCSRSTVSQFVESLAPATNVTFPERTVPPQYSGPDPGIELRQERQVQELDQFNQLLLRESPFVRREFMAKLDTNSVEAYDKSVKQYRDFFRQDVIGDFGYDLLPPNARTRKAYETDKWIGYEVVLDVWPIDSKDSRGEAPDVNADAAEKPPFNTVIAFGVLLVPKDLNLEGGERRPVVVCQHGLEGRPKDVIEGDVPAYHDFAAKLAERGFITFAPQNLYIGQDKFRTLQRKANPLGKTLFSVIVPQHQQIVNWLKSLPYVDSERIAFYGLSYGGKSAMRIPALVTDYCLSICSADFNEWVLKNASTRHPFSYVWTGEYEIFEFDLGSTFNYAEMAALICPRPFMVERGHFDGVGWDEYVAYEYAKVRHLYQAKLGIGDRTEIEWFVGPHTINGQGTYAFLHKHLKWPEPEEGAAAGQ